MPLKYNPLLKIGLENTGNGGGDVDEKIAALQNAVNALQESLNALKNSKITKVTASSQLAELTDGEIFEWQAASTNDFTQGYFYKKNGNNYPRVDLQPNYSLPIAAANLLGGVKVGTGLNIDAGGVLSVTAGDSLKVPRCFTDAQIAALTDGDIFEWQGETTADYTQGYFYKKTSNTVTLVHTGDLYLKNTVSYLRGNYSIAPGYYIGVEWTTENITGSFCNRNSDSTRFYFSFLPAVVGQQALVTNQSDGFGDFIEYVTVAAVNTYGYPSAYSDGVSVTFVRQTPMNSAKFYQFKNTVTNNLAWFAVFQNGNYYNNYACAIIDNGIIYPMGRCNETITVAKNDITETTIISNRVDTQTRELSISNNNQLQFTDNNGNVYNIPQNSNLTDGSLLQWSDPSKSIVIANRNIVWNQKTVTFVNGSLSVQLDSWLFIFGRVVTVILQGVKSIGSDYVNQTLYCSSSDFLPIEARPAYSRRVVCPAMVSDVFVGYIALRVNPTGQLLLNCSYAQQVEFYASITYVM